MKQLRKSKRPVVLTVKGKAAAVVQDADAYQRLLDWSLTRQYSVEWEECNAAICSPALLPAIIPAP